MFHKRNAYGVKKITNGILFLRKKEAPPEPLAGEESTSLVPLGQDAVLFTLIQRGDRTWGRGSLSSALFYNATKIRELGTRVSYSGLAALLEVSFRWDCPIPHMRSTQVQRKILGHL